MNTNPFEVLRLDPSATEEEIVRQAGRLRQRATDETTRNAIRQAVQALTARTEDRLLHALLTHPAPCYQSPALEHFAAAFRRPAAFAEVAPACPALDVKEFADLIKEKCAEELELPSLPFEAVPASEDADEIRRQTAEVLWLSLLFDTRA